MAFLYKALAHNLEKWGWVKLAKRKAIRYKVAGLNRNFIASLPATAGQYLTAISGLGTFQKTMLLFSFLLFGMI